VIIPDPLAQPVSLAVDTNLLLLLLGYQCLLFEKTVPLQRARVLKEIRGRDDNISPERFDSLWHLFQTAKRRIVTQHVIAETYGLRKLLAKLGLPKDLVWDSAKALLDDPGIEENPARFEICLSIRVIPTF
jgi:hypothetical protein